MFERIARELLFAIIQYDVAMKMCPKGDMAERAELALNLGQAYGRVGKPEERLKWIIQAKRWAPEGSIIFRMLEQITVEDRPLSK